jgi:hypothetical protein
VLCRGGPDHAHSEDIMKQTEPQTTFRGLPLLPEQDSEIRHYIHLRTRNGADWNTAELEAMVRDMLDPPELDDEDGSAAEK